MSKEFLYMLGALFLAWLGYLCWHLGFQAGYAEGKKQAWDAARAFYTPEEAQSKGQLLQQDELEN